MSKIKQVLRLHAQGVSNRKIAASLGIYKGTVNNYVHKITSHQWSLDELLSLEDPELERVLFAGNPAYKQERFDEFKEMIPYFEEELKKRHVTRYIIWQEYRQDHPEGYGYSQFCFHLGQVANARKPRSILHYNPAEKLLVDFAGDTVSYIDRETGEAIQTQVFVACLPYSDYTFIMAVPSQRTDDFLYALACCLNHLGGSPKIIIPDNLKAAVIKADRYEPELNRLMEDFANHYGIAVIPARAVKPKDKAAVENEVKIIYRRVYAKLRHHTFFSIDEINQAFAEKIREHNQTRQQQKDYCRQEKFLAEEKALLKELPKETFEVKYYTSLKIALNNCVYLARDKHYYSAPFQYIGQQADIIYTRSLVRIYVMGECVATHKRSVGFGYTTLKEHMSSSHNFYQSRSPEFYIRQAKKHSDTLAELFTAIFKGVEVPEIMYKRCDGLLALQRRTDPVTFERVCRYALENSILTLKSIKRVVDNKSYLHEMWQEDNQGNINMNIKHINIRGKKYYVG
ncbi:MAG: IS21 family transposase [Fermentimonas sp.]|nr:IS21 family transposase [Fermentimonas sp.]